MQKIGENVSDDQLHDILSEVDLNRNAQVDLGEFLQVRMTALLCCICLYGTLHVSVMAASLSKYPFHLPIFSLWIDCVDTEKCVSLTIVAFVYVWHDLFATNTLHCLCTYWHCL